MRCKVATYFDGQEQQCLPCSDGCLSCQSCYSCTQCRPEYTYNSYSQLCNEVCGDGLRFNLACDDGNNVDGDGCSSDCKIETGYNCMGGSPNSKDTCSNYRPSVLVLKQAGMSHLPRRIILNINLNFLPQKLLDSATDCRNSCDSILDVDIIKGFKYFKSIRAKYVPSTSYSFAVDIDFGRQAIGKFTVQIALKRGIALKYFSGIDCSQKLYVEVNPMILSVYRGSNEDTLD